VKRYFSVALVTVMMIGVFILPANAAVVIDGVVGPVEWYDCPMIDLFPGPSLCSIENAIMRYEVIPALRKVNFGFTATAPDAIANSPVGVVFLIDGQEIVRWQNGVGAVCDEANYGALGAAWIPPDSANGGYSFEVAVNCYSDSALIALRGLQVQLIDPDGSTSRIVSCPLTIPDPPQDPPPDPPEPPTPTHCWENWSPCLQWIMRYLLFGWLWMK